MKHTGDGVPRLIADTLAAAITSASEI